MIHLGNVWSIARAEMRLVRRVVRFWVFTVIAALFALLSYVQFWVIHFFFSAGSASAASAYPRYFMGPFGSNFVFFMLVGLIFIGFDLRARDTRERMVEVLDSLPYSNAELVCGKFLGILVPAWISSLVIAILLVVMAFAMGTPIEPWSIVTFIVFMSIPAYAFFLGLVFLAASVLRHRLVVALTVVAALVLVFVAQRFWIPLYAFPLIDFTGGFAAPFPSDIVPRLVDAAGLVQRLATLLAGLGFMVLAVAAHPRLDDGSRLRQAALGSVLALVGVGLLFAQVAQGRASIARKVHWRDVHSSRATEPAPDLLATTGTVRLDPGRGLELDIALRLRPAPGARAAVFTLNPGLEVRSLKDAHGGAVPFTHEDGLLSVDLPGGGADDERTLRLAIMGRPEPTFSYLDATVEAWERKGADAALLILGFESSLLEQRFVALPPGVFWLPASGTATAHVPDFQEVDLTVDVPEGLVVAGPGRRQEAEGAERGRVRYRFAPGNPLPDVALVAGRYESRSIEVDGTLLEILVHPSHANVFELFSDAGKEISTWLEEKLHDAKGVGLAYPYDALTMVEVPNMLRGYGGGWRMDSTLIQPGLILMRESGFPTARFARGWTNPEQYRDREGGLSRRKREVLERFFENDMNGGNPFIAAARSFFGFQTAASGPAGPALDFVFEDLASRLVTRHRGYFSYRIFNREFGTDFQAAGQQMGNPDRVGDDYADVLIHRLTSRPEVWESVLEASLVQLDPWTNPEQAIDVLALKGGAMAQSMLDDVGREQAGRLLAALREARRGTTFARDDVVTIGASQALELEPWMSTWLDQTELPGFTVGGVQVFRIKDADDASPRYQSIVTVRNEERVPGLVKLEYRKGEGTKRADRGATTPVRVEGRSAVEIGLITPEPPTALRVAPYLALNRDPFSVTLPPIDREKLVEAEPFSGARPVDWQPADEGIVVDDLDRGFSIEDSGERAMLRVAGRGQDEKLDQGLPIATRLAEGARWSRLPATTAYGKYRHTLATIAKGDGARRAVFNAELPESGSWELEYFLPPPPSHAASRAKLGTWGLTLVDGSGERPIQFDARGGEHGWNSLGTFEIAAGDVRLVVSNKTDGDYVVADAIRWSRARGAGPVASR